jgi:hypothetical protein
MAPAGLDPVGERGVEKAGPATRPIPTEQRHPSRRSTVGAWLSVGRSRRRSHARPSRLNTRKLRLGGLSVGRLPRRIASESRGAAPAVWYSPKTMPSSPLTITEESEASTLLSTHGFPTSTSFSDPETIREIIGRAKEPGVDGASLAAELAATSKDEDFRNSALALSDALLPLGIIVNFPRIIWGKIPTIVSMAASAHAHGGKSARAKLGQFLTLETLDPPMRAFKVCHAKRIPHIADVSHYLEAATFALYDGRCLDAANNLIVCVERLLLSHLGWRLGAQEGKRELRTVLTVDPMVS